MYPRQDKLGENLHSDLSDFSVPVLFLFDYAASFLFMVVFNSLGMAHNLQLRRCLKNVHRLDDE